MARFLKMRIKIKDDAADIERKIAKAVSQEFNRKISTGVNNIERDIKSLARDLLSVSPEIQSLRNGELRGAFGIPKEIDPTLGNAEYYYYSEINCNEVYLYWDIELEP